MYLKQGKISVGDIMRIAKELGEPISEKEVHDMIQEADHDSKLLLSPTKFAQLDDLYDNIKLKVCHFSL